MILIDLNGSAEVAPTKKIELSIESSPSQLEESPFISTLRDYIEKDEHDDLVKKVPA